MALNPLLVNIHIPSTSNSSSSNPIPLVSRSKYSTPQFSILKMACFRPINEIHEQALLNLGLNESLLRRGYQPFETTTKERFHKMGCYLRNHSHTVAAQTTRAQYQRLAGTRFANAPLQSKPPKRRKQPKEGVLARRRSPRLLARQQARLEESREQLLHDLQVDPAFMKRGRVRTSKLRVLSGTKTPSHKPWTDPQTIATFRGRMFAPSPLSRIVH